MFLAQVFSRPFPGRRGIGPVAQEPLERSADTAVELQHGIPAAVTLLLSHVQLDAGLLSQEDQGFPEIDLLHLL